jgi:hypothetical protein
MDLEHAAVAPHHCIASNSRSSGSRKSKTMNAFGADAGVDGRQLRQRVVGVTAITG